MKITWFTTLLMVGCLAGSSFAAQGQTARIAYLGHGGNSEAAGALEKPDNFGIPYRTVFKADTVVATSDTTAVAHGTLSRLGSDDGGTRVERSVYYGKYYGQNSTEAGSQSRAAAVKRLQQRYPDAKMLGFDTAAVGKPAATPSPPLKKEKTKRKRHGEAMLPGAPPASPQHPGVWLALAAIIGLGAAGLLLGDKPRPVLRKTA